MRRKRLRRTAVGGGAVLLGVLLGVFVAAGATPLDEWWRGLVAPDRGGVLLYGSQALNLVGGGWAATFAVPLTGALVLVLLRRPWHAGYLLVAEAVSAGAVQLGKAVFDRARPDDIMVVSDAGSFPSGHVANAATLAVVLWVVLPRWWTLAVGAVWVLAMAYSRTYLSAHWLTDTAGGALIGGGVALLIAIPFAAVLRAETAAGAWPRARPR